MRGREREPGIYLPFAVALDFTGISVNSILPLTMTRSLDVRIL